MSIYNILAFNAAHDQVQKNIADSQAIDAKRVENESKQQDLDIAKRTAESQVKIANNKGLISDWSTKQIIDGQKDQVKPYEDYYQAVSEAQDKAQHDAQQKIQQGTQVASHLVANDPDVQKHVASTLSGIMNTQNPQGGQPTTPPMSMPDGTTSGNTSVGLPSIPGIAPIQGGASPQNVDAQVTAQPGAPTPSVQAPTVQPSTPQAMPQPQQSQSTDQSSQENSPQTQLTPISSIMSKMDNIPYGDPRAQMRDTMVKNPNYNMQLAMGSTDAKPYTPITADVLDRENPLRLSPAQEQIRQHIPELLDKGYSKDEIIQNLPKDLGAMVKSIGDYKRPESELLNRATPAFRTALTGLISELYPNYSESAFKERNAFANDMAKTTPQSFGGQVVSLNTLAMHLGELNNKLLVAQNQGIPVKNAFVNFVQNNLGHPEVNDFNAAKEIYSNEMQRLLTGKAATQSGVGREAETLNQNASTGQLQAVLKTNANMVVDKINSLRDKYKDTMGEDDGNKVIKPQARKLLNSIVGYDKFSSYDNGQEGSLQEAKNNQQNTSPFTQEQIQAEIKRRGL